MTIPKEGVKAVLLFDGWHFIQSKSFQTETYQFVETESNTGSGFRFVDNGEAGLCPSGTTIAGPVSSIIAVEIES